MAKFNCFCSLGGRKKKEKGNKEILETAVGQKKGLKILQVKLETPEKSSEVVELNSTSFSVAVPFAIPGNSRCMVKVVSHESPVGAEAEAEDAAALAYEGEDEQDENSPLKRNFSDFDLQGHTDNDQSLSTNKDSNLFDSFETTTEKIYFSEEITEIVRSGHMSDPGIRKAEFLASPKLQRSCSDLQTSDMLKEIAHKLPLSKSQSFEEMQRLAEKMQKEVLQEYPGSPVSVTTHFSADRVILKKHSSSQILPSRSRKLWWKLFLWSHRNDHGAWTVKSKPAALNQQGGYSSDTLEPRRLLEMEKLGSPGSFTGESMNKHSNSNVDNQSWDGFHGVSGLWPQNQWVAFSLGSFNSNLSRVDEWVKEISNQPPPPPPDNEKQSEEIIVYPPSPEGGGRNALARNTSHLIPEEVLHANAVIQSLNASSTVAHILGMGLKVIPTMSHLSSLRSVNLSGNHIAHITAGYLPKGLHTLNLSRNKISVIEGLKELDRLRVLDLSYNRLSRIGQGLSNCTLIKELYLAGNKISDVEGLHRLLKLTILDLSFNKITTSKALGQLVANYNSLLALNLLGNPIQSNISDEQLRKAVCGLLPKLAYLNKQPVNPQKAREVATEAITKAVMGGNSGWGRSRKSSKRVSATRQGGAGASSSSSIRRSRHTSRSRAQTSHRTKSSMLASSSR